MSKKSELHSITREMYKEMKSLFQYFQSNLQSENKYSADTTNTAVTKVDILRGKFEYLLGNMQVPFHDAAEAAAIPYGCESAHMMRLMGGDFDKLYRCIGVVESIAHKLIDQMF